MLHYISHASIQSAHVQCLILMSSFLCSVNCLPQAWLLVGQAVRTAQDLGLHVSCFKSAELDHLSNILFSGHLVDLPLRPLKRKLVAKSGGACTPSTGCLR